MHGETVISCDQAFNFAFKDTIKALFPKYNSKTEFWKFFAANMASGGLAGAGSLTIVYPLDYARTRLASDVGSGNPQFNGLADCLMKTMQTGGFFSMYAFRALPKWEHFCVLKSLSCYTTSFGAFESCRQVCRFRRVCRWHRGLSWPVLWCL